MSSNQAFPAATLPPFSRDSRGLVVGLNYSFTPDGRVDYRRMVDAKHLYIPRESEERVVAEQGVPLAEVDISRVRDEWLRIRVGGINQLANIRGYRTLEYPIFTSREGNATAVCRMEFIGNYESDMQPLVCSASASACRGSMDKKFLPYLETFAENRAFVRCVKRALQINVLSDIEIGGDGREATTDDDTSNAAAASTPAGFEPAHRLQKICRDSKPEITFEAVKAAALKYKDEMEGDVTKWTNWDSIEPRNAWVIAGKILEKAEAAKKGK